MRTARADKGDRQTGERIDMARGIAAGWCMLALAACAPTNAGLDDYDRDAAISIDEPRSAAATTEAVDPAIWSISDADTTIYLLGTFHLLPEEYDWRTPVIDAAIADSDTLVVETVVDADNPQELGQLMARMGFARDLPPILQRVTPDKRPTLQRMIARSGVPESAFDMMESWAAGLTLYSLTASDLGLTGEAGAEADLRAAFTLAGKGIEQLETNEQQLSYFDNLSPEAQGVFLDSVVASPETVKGMFADMLAAWTRGDTEAIAASFNESMPVGSDLRRALLTSRNRNWANWIDARMDRPGTVMVAVGAGHLVGDDSMLLMLSLAGHRAQRLD